MPSQVQIKLESKVQIVEELKKAPDLLQIFVHVRMEEIGQVQS